MNYTKDEITVYENSERSSLSARIASKERSYITYKSYIKYFFHVDEYVCYLENYIFYDFEGDGNCETEMFVLSEPPTIDFIRDKLLEYIRKDLED